jgi:hypothetical protein
MSDVCHRCWREIAGCSVYLIDGEPACSPCLSDREWIACMEQAIDRLQVRFQELRHHAYPGVPPDETPDEFFHRGKVAEVLDAALTLAEELEETRWAMDPANIESYAKTIDWGAEAARRERKHFPDDVIARADQARAELAVQRLLDPSV